MAARLTALPLFVLLMGCASVAMAVPALQAAVGGSWQEAQVFGLAALLFGLLTGLVATATAGQAPRDPARAQLLTLLAAMVALPAMLAVPFHAALDGVPFWWAYFEMVSSLTTTGATLWDDPGALSPTLHLWRALVGWMGGFLAWVTAYALLAPMNLGGFEVTARTDPGLAGRRGRERRDGDETTARVVRFALRLLPLYAGLTFLVWTGLSVTGEEPLTATCHAMSILATSGISPVGGLHGGAAGIPGEIVILPFFLLALTRHSYAWAATPDSRGRLGSDPELWLGLLLAVLVTSFLFLRHWTGALEGDEAGGAAGPLRALWGSLFTVLSFLTTTGFVSQDWGAAQGWSGLETPGLLLVGLALIGGGVATTAGGVKLLRVYALYRHGRRELDKLVHPSSVGGSGMVARRIRREGAYIAWVFFMLFAVSIAGVMSGLALTGVDFETSTVLTIAALSTTGPLAAIGGEAPISYAGLPAAAQAILAAAMVLGRLETLAIVALFSPRFWRR